MPAILILIGSGELEQVADYRGPVGYNDSVGPYFKFGIYRDDIPATDVVYWDEYKRYGPL